MLNRVCNFVVSGLFIYGGAYSMGSGTFGPMMIGSIAIAIGVSIMFINVFSMLENYFRDLMADEPDWDCEQKD